MITNGPCWIFSRSSQDFLLMFSEFPQDGLRIFSGCSDGSCGPGRSLRYSRSGGSDRSCESCESDRLGGSGVFWVFSFYLI